MGSGEGGKGFEVATPLLRGSPRFPKCLCDPGSPAGLGNIRCQASGLQRRFSSYLGLMKYKHTEGG